MQISQYLCSRCGSVLKETSEYIEIHSIKEECPSCGSMLAESLMRRPKQRLVKIPPPTIQRADTLMKLRFDIPKIDSFIALGARDLCCISGYGSNLLLTRLCVRSLLPNRYGGLNSPYVMVADAGNRTDVYRTINFARQYGLHKENVAERILVARAFTVTQVRRLLSVDLPKIIKDYKLRSVIIPGLLSAFDEDPNMRAKDAKREIARIMSAINELCSRVLVVTSVMDGRHSDSVLPHIKKRINLTQERNEKVKAEIRSHDNVQTVYLTDRDMLVVPRK